MMTWSVSKGFVACLGNLHQTNLLPSTRWEINWWNGHQFAQGLDTTLSKCYGGRTPFPSRFPLLCTFPQGYFLKHILFKLSLNWSHLTTKSTDKCCPTHQHLRRAQESSLHRRGATVPLKVVYYETQPPNFSCDTAQGFWGLACFQSDSRRESVKKKKKNWSWCRGICSVSACTHLQGVLPQMAGANKKDPKGSLPDTPDRNETKTHGIFVTQSPGSRKHGVKGVPLKTKQQ